MPRDDINYRFRENGVDYDFYDVFVPAELFRKPSLWAWGQNSAGETGFNNTTNSATPATTFLGGTNWKSTSAVGGFNSVIKSDGTLWTWGGGGYGQLGNNNTVSRSTPVTTFLGGNNWKVSSGGGRNSYAIKTDGTLWTWGQNSRGELGINSTTQRNTPVTTILGGNNWKSVAAGNFFSLAIKTDGSLWAWGDNGFGQIGIGVTSLGISTPTTTFLGGNNWKSVSGGESHTAAIKSDGTIWTWGRNNRGQLGINNTIDRSTPVTTFLGGTNWKSISCGFNHTAAIKTDGTLWIWGSNDQGELGINNTIDRSTPVTTFAGGTNWKYIDCGNRHTATIKTDGTLWTWGRGDSGQLGINAFAGRSTPVTTFLGGNNWKSVSGGFEGTIAIQYIPDP